MENIWNRVGVAQAYYEEVGAKIQERIEEVRAAYFNSYYEIHERAREIFHRAQESIRATSRVMATDVMTVQVLSPTIKAFNSTVTLMHALPDGSANIVADHLDPMNAMLSGASKVFNLIFTSNKIDDLVSGRAARGGMHGVPNFFSMAKVVAGLASDMIGYVKVGVDAKLLSADLMRREVARIKIGSQEVGVTAAVAQTALNVFVAAMGILNTFQTIAVQKVFRVGDAMALAIDTTKVTATFLDQVPAQEARIAAAVVNLTSALLSITSNLLKSSRADRVILLNYRPELEYEV